MIEEKRAVVLTDVDLTADAFIALAGALGELRPARVRHPSLQPPASDYIFVGVRTAASPTPRGRGDAAHHWHVDYSSSASFPRLSILYALTMPENGSRTGFADMRAVYQALPKPLQDRVEHLGARHYNHPQGVDVLPAEEQIRVPWNERLLGAVHPLVMRDAKGRPFLCIPPHHDSPVCGMDEEQSRQLISELWSYVETFGMPWEYEQASGEVMIWDNRALAHRRSEWPLNKDRLIWFVSTT